MFNRTSKLSDDRVPQAQKTCRPFELFLPGFTRGVFGVARSFLVPLKVCIGL